MTENSEKKAQKRKSSQDSCAKIQKLDKEKSPQPGCSKDFDKVEKKRKVIQPKLVSKEPDEDVFSKFVKLCLERKSDKETMRETKVIIQKLEKSYKKLSLCQKSDNELKLYIEMCHNKIAKGVSSNIYSPISELYTEIKRRIEMNEVENTEETFEEKELSETDLKKLELLENAINKCREKIKELENTDVNMSEDNENSAFIQEEKYVRKLIQLCKQYSKISGNRDMKKQMMKKKIRKQDIPFEMTNIPLVDNAILNFINEDIDQVNRLKYLDNPNKFADHIKVPEYMDIVECIQTCNKSCKLGLKKEEIKELAAKAFKAIVEFLQKKRTMETKFYFGEFDDKNEDPALKDPALNKKLQENQRNGKRKLDEIFEKYAKEQVSPVQEDTEKNDQVDAEDGNKIDTDDESDVDNQSSVKNFSSEEESDEIIDDKNKRRVSNVHKLLKDNESDTENESDVENESDIVNESDNDSESSTKTLKSVKETDKKVDDKKEKVISNLHEKCSTNYKSHEEKKEIQNKPQVKKVVKISKVFEDDNDGVSAIKISEIKSLNKNLSPAHKSNEVGEKNKNLDSCLIENSLTDSKKDVDYGENEHSGLINTPKTDYSNESKSLDENESLVEEINEFVVENKNLDPSSKSTKEESKLDKKNVHSTPEIILDESDDIVLIDDNKDNMKINSSPRKETKEHNVKIKNLDSNLVGKNVINANKNKAENQASKKRTDVTAEIIVEDDDDDDEIFVIDNKDGFVDSTKVQNPPDSNKLSETETECNKIEVNNEVDTIESSQLSLHTVTPMTKAGLPNVLAENSVDELEIEESSDLDMLAYDVKSLTQSIQKQKDTLSEKTQVPQKLTEPDCIDLTDEIEQPLPLPSTFVNPFAKTKREPQCRRY